MFWCVVSLYIFTHCMYFDSSKYHATRKYIQQYYMYIPKHLIRYLNSRLPEMPGPLLENPRLNNFGLQDQ